VQNEGVASVPRHFDDRHMKFESLHFSKAAYVADSLAYALLVVIASTMLALFGPRDEWRAIVLLMAVGLIVWSFLEYVIHRFILHGIEPFRSMHVEHHDRPHELIGKPTLLSGALFVAFVLVPSVAMMDLWKGIGLTLGVATGYLAYGWVHHAVHHWQPGTHWLRRRKQLHAMHHRTGDRHYGVTTSLWDGAFRSGSAKHGAQSGS
jgi:hypothetical protein